jgi:hypothetical protein
MTTAESGGLTDIAVAFGAEPYTQIASNEPYGVGEGNPDASSERGAAKREFVAGENAWPHIIMYPLLDRHKLNQAASAYLSQLNEVILHNEMTGGETDEAEVLYEQIARKLAEVFRYQKIVRLVGHVAAGDMELAETARMHAAAMNEELFGAPEEGQFKELIAPDIHNALSHIGSEDEIRDRIASEYLALLGFVKEDGLADTDAAAAYIEGISLESPFELSEQAMQVIRSDFFTLYPGMEEAIRPYMGRTENAKPIDAVPAFDAVLQAGGLLNWHTRLIPDKKQSCETSGVDKEITFGENREDFTPRQLVTRPFHEWIHAKRWANAFLQKEPHMRTELPGMLSFEEGFATVIEQIIDGVKRVPGVKYYVQLGLLKGIHKAGMGEEQAYRTAYEIMWRRDALQAKGVLSGKRQGQPRESAYSSVMRTARGNARDSRDISYFEGARLATQFLNETARLPEDIRFARILWVMSGKFDPTNPQHVELYGGDPAAEYLAGA